MKHIQQYTSAGVLVTHFLVLLLINSFVLGALLPASAELGLDAFRLGKERLGKAFCVIPFILDVIFYRYFQHTNYQNKHRFWY